VTNEPLWRYIVNRVPEYNEVVSALGADYLADSAYLAVSALYDFAVKAHTAGRHDVVTRTLAALEEALRSGDPAVVDPFSVDFVEALAGDATTPHFRSWRNRLGPSTSRDLAAKISS
jgi:hypothetical protein